MKLLNQYIDPKDAAEDKSRLRAAGIASRVGAMDPHVIQPSKSGATHTGLWVLADDQLEDAIRILEDPGHKPRRVLSPREIDRLEASMDKQTRAPRRFDRVWVLFLFAILIGLILFTAADYFPGL